MTPIFYFKVQNFGNSKVEDDSIRDDKAGEFKKKFLQCNKRLTVLFMMAGIRFFVSNRQNQKDPIWIKLYRMLVVLVALFQVLPNVTTLMITLRSPGMGHNFIPAFLCDNLLVIFLFLCYWGNYSRIRTIIDQLLVKMECLHLEPEIFSLMKRCSHALFSFGFSHFLITSFIVCVEACLWRQWFAKFVLNNCYLIYVPAPLVKPVLCFCMIQYHFLTTCVYLHFSLIILIVYMLFCCFKQLNHRLKYSRNLELDDLQQIQNDHHYLATMVRQTSKAFSPTILILVGVKCAQIIFGVNVMSWGFKVYKDAQASFWNHIIKTSITFANAVGFILMLTVIGGKLHNEAQKTINALLNISLHNNEMYIVGGPNKAVKSCHITGLFTSQIIASPIGISASDLFVINYSFLALIISTTLTYMTILPSA